MMQCQKELFRLAEDVTYLNCAYMSPLLKTVVREGMGSMIRKFNPQTIQPNDFFSEVQALKSTFAQLINLDDPGRLAIIPSASYGLANVANNVKVKPGQRIILVEEQFPSNYYAWEKLEKKDGAVMEMVSPADSDNRSQSWNEQILAAIDEQTALVAIGHVHWADGTIFNLKKIREKCSSVGALLIIDGTQSVGALPFDVQEIRPDALICAGYKWLMGPYSIGLAYYGPYFDTGEPIEENWINRKDSEQFSGLVNYQPEYHSKAARYSVGEQSNFILIPMQNEAIRQLNEWGAENIQNYCKSISSEFSEKVHSLGFTIENEKNRCGHLFGIRAPSNLEIKGLKSTLEANKIYVSVRGTAIRISPHVYNTEADFGRLLNCLQNLK